MTGRPTSGSRPLLTVRELAEIVGVNPSTLYRAITRGEFPVPIVRFGDRIRVPRTAVETLIYASDETGQSNPPDRTNNRCPSCSATQRRPAPCSTTRWPRPPQPRP
jgi:excisionase family DNA binding protein